MWTKYTSVSVCVCLCVCIYVLDVYIGCVCFCVCVCVCVCLCVCICVSCRYVCAYVCVHVCSFVFQCARTLTKSKWRKLCFYPQKVKHYQYQATYSLRRTLNSICLIFLLQLLLMSFANRLLSSINYFLECTNSFIYIILFISIIHIFEIWDN